jgi:hypothetical protein
MSIHNSNIDNLFINNDRNKSLQSKKNNKLYCIICNKKLPIFTIKCKCNKKLCSLHRYPNEHDCTYDYKQSYQEELKIKNKKLKIEKVNKI